MLKQCPYSEILILYILSQSKRYYKNAHLICLVRQIKIEHNDLLVRKTLFVILLKSTAHLTTGHHFISLIESKPSPAKNTLDFLDEIWFWLPLAKKSGLLTVAFMNTGYVNCNGKHKGGNTQEEPFTLLPSSHSSWSPLLYRWLSAFLWLWWSPTITWFCCCFATEVCWLWIIMQVSDRQALWYETSKGLWPICWEPLL